MISTEAAQAALARALKRGGDFADCFVEQRHAASVSMEDSRVERVQAGTEQGAGLRVVTGLTTAFAYTDDLSADGLLRAADAAAAAARGGNGTTAVVDLRERPTGEQRLVMPPDGVDTARKVDLLRRADDVARSESGDVRQVTAMFAQGVQSILVANSDGTLARDRRTRVRLLIQAVAARGNEVQSGMESPGSAEGFEFFESGEEVERAAREAAERATLLLDADPAPAGTMPVVLGNGFGGVLFHEASGHGLEADAIAKRASVFAGRVGEMVASPLVTAVDDGTVDTGWGTLRIDDEGVPTRRNVLIEEGVLTGYMFDRLRARQDGRDSTGNGRRQAYQPLPLPRMTNTFILPGLSTVEERIEGTPYGLYAQRLDGGQVNPVTGHF